MAISGKYGEIDIPSPKNWARKSDGFNDGPAEQKFRINS